uniref:Uncharacterized protein n=1 Tax=Podoviridae sp. ctG4L18 TaxID=2825234 RepID=A0A8S5UPR3_9CAUD|nr:MAG TPA: hypothetical protein [Podoviridae sp. ctG4L18]
MSTNQQLYTSTNTEEITIIKSGTSRMYFIMLVHLVVQSSLI